MSRLVPTEIGNGTVLETLGLAVGNALLDVLYNAPDFRYVKPLLEQGRLRIDAPPARAALDGIAAAFTFPAHFGKNLDALYDCMTDPLHKSGPQPGFIVVLEQIPANARFDKEAREQLLDVFRDAADYWGDRRIPFRCFYSFQ